MRLSYLSFNPVWVTVVILVASFNFDFGVNFKLAPERGFQVTNIEHKGDSVVHVVYNYPGFVLDQTEEGEVYDLVCYNHSSEIIPSSYLATKRVEVALCQQYDSSDHSGARFPVRTFMQVAEGSWMEVIHFEDDRIVSIQENPDETIKVDSIFVNRPDTKSEEVYIYRYLSMIGRE